MSSITKQVIYKTKTCVQKMFQNEQYMQTICIAAHISITLAIPNCT